MITIVVISGGNMDRLNRTAESLKTMAQNIGDRIRIVTVGAGDPDIQDETVVDTEYVLLLPEGAVLAPDTLDLALKELESHNTDAVLLTETIEDPNRMIAKEKRVVKSGLRKPEAVLKAPANLGTMIVRTSRICNLLNCDTLTRKELLRSWNDPFLACAVSEKKELIRIEPAFCGEAVRGTKISFVEERWTDADWYFELLEHWKTSLNRYKAGEIPLLVQAQVVREIRCCLNENKDNKDNRAFSSEETDRFLEECHCLLERISGVFITPENFGEKGRKLSYSVCSALMSLRCGGAYCPDQQDLLPYVTLMLMEYENDMLRIDFGIDPYAVKNLELQLLINGEPFPCEQTTVRAGAVFLERPLARKKTFVLKLPYRTISDHDEISFILTDGARRIPLPIVSVDYQAKLTQLLANAYWCFGDYMAVFSRETTKNQSPAPGRITGIHISRAGKRTRAARELHLMKEIASAPYGSRRMFLFRLLYWLTFPFYAGKNIWITFDKLYKGGDCGEYFYKYMESRKKDGITPEYIIRKEVPDYKRLRQEGYHPLVFRSVKAQLSYLHASMIFATHSSVHAFCGFTRWKIRFMQDRLHAVNTCIQHGLSVQDLTADSNRLINNNKRYYCASPCEIENLSKPEYDYDRDVLRLTGIPRYDGLLSDDRKQILITPTWRAYIAMPAVMGEARPYNPDFKNTEYFRIYQELLDNGKLKETAARTGYKIIYLLHPVTSSQAEDYHTDGNIEIACATETNYEKILTESSLMVTDYSGVQFDFAYMRKPVVYFHPPELPPHYVEGGFFYETQGFGEICTETERLVDLLCEYMEKGCGLKEFYRKRQDRFFAFEDHENCRRIFEDALEYQRRR